MTYNVFRGTLNLAQSINQSINQLLLLLLLLLLLHTDLCVGFVSHKELCVCVERMNTVDKVRHLYTTCTLQYMHRFISRISKNTHTQTLLN